MTGSRTIAVGVSFLLLSAGAAHAQTPARYRDFRLGDTLASVSAAAGVAAAQARTITVRPATVQDLEWRRPYTLTGDTAPDPVEQIAFSFYNDQLSRMAIDYARDRTDGMTDADMIEGISAMYGDPVVPVGEGGVAVAGGEPSAARVAAWGDAEHTAVLYRSIFGSRFKLVVTAVRLDALAGAARSDALLLDKRDAPQRERAREQKDADDARAAQEKARTANKAAFKP
jgi:hypothetical protein